MSRLGGLLQAHANGDLSWTLLENMLVTYPYRTPVRVVNPPRDAADVELAEDDDYDETDTWDEVRNAMNDGIITFEQYLDVIRRRQDMLVMKLNPYHTRGHGRGHPKLDGGAAGGGAGGGDAGTGSASSSGSSAGGAYANEWNWEKSQPWAISKEEFTVNPPAGLHYNPSLPNEARNERELGRGIQIGRTFFDLPTQTRRAVLYHELGHDLADQFVHDGSMWELVNDALWKRAGMRSLNGQTVPTEVLAEAYSVLNDEPSWLHEHFPSLVEPVTRKAHDMGLPLTKK